MTSNPPIQIQPMLAKTYNNTPITSLHYLEPKLDGLRGVVYVDGKSKAHVFSRNGKPLWNTEHILYEIESHSKVSMSGVDVVLDGEFFVENWNVSMSITKTQDVHPRRMELRYHIWDVVSGKDWRAGKSSKTLRERRDDVEDYDGENVKAVPQVEVFNMEEAMIAYADFMQQGYEGGMLKTADGLYETDKRSKAWLKMKPWFDADLKVVGAYAGKDKHEGRLGGFCLEGEVELEDKKIFITTKVGTGFDDNERELFQEMWDQGSLIGRIAEIKYQEITADGSCRFPVFHRLRQDKE